MRNRVVGLIGVLWGGGILVSSFLRSGPAGGSAYQSGQTAGYIFGAILFGAGLFYLIRGSGKNSSAVKE